MVKLANPRMSAVMSLTADEVSLGCSSQSVSDTAPPIEVEEIEDVLDLTSATLNSMRAPHATEEALAEPLDAEEAALALAAVRAEVRRLERAQTESQRALRLRDGWLDNARAELKHAADQRQALTAQLQDANKQLEQAHAELAQKNSRIAVLEAIPAHREPLSDVGKITAPHRTVDFDPERTLVLEPIDHVSDPVVLNRNVMTVGRTAESDMCVPSKLVSRDHARLVVTGRGVTLIDMDSANGCYINHRPVRKAPLHEGDVLHIGDRCFRLTSQPKLAAQ